MSPLPGVLLLLMLTCLAVEGTTSSTSSEDGTGREEFITDMTKSSAANSTEALEVEAARMGMLQEIAENSFKLSLNVSLGILDHEVVTLELVNIFEGIVALSASREQASVTESPLVSNITSNLETITWRLLSNYSSGFNVNFSNSGRIKCLPSNNSFLKNELSIVYFTEIYSANGFNVFSTLTHEERSFQIVYPENVTSLHGLPDAEVPITRHQVVFSTYLDRITQNFSIQPINYSITLMQWILDYRPNAKHRCAFWSRTENRWSSQNCKSFVSKEMPWNVSCCCEIATDFESLRQMSELVLYELEEDIASTIKVESDSVPAGSTDSDAVHLREYEAVLRAILVQKDLSARYSEYLATLSAVVSLGSAILINSVDGKFLEDIGTILQKAQPEAGKSTTGIRNNNLASFVINLSSYKHDPPIGFGVYDNYTYGMEYFRLVKDMDLGELFSGEMSYSFLFSKSVASQNSRFAFLLYPPDKFFRSAAVIDGHQVVRMRVLDVVLTRREQLDQEQLVHMFLGPITDRELVPGSGLVPGCASWSGLLGNWTSRDCHPNPDLHDGVCTCNMTSNSIESPSRGQFIVFTYLTLDFMPDSSADSAIDNANETQIAIKNLKAYSYFCPRWCDVFALWRGTFEELETVILNTAWTGSDLRQVTADSRTIVNDEMCYTYNYTESGDGYYLTAGTFLPICGKQQFNDSYIILTGFNLDLHEKSANSLFFTGDTFSASQVFSNKSLYALRVSPSVLLKSNSHAFLLYPVGKMFYPAPRVQGINSFRMVDVIVYPNSQEYEKADQNDQYVEFYQDNAPHLSVGCAHWSDELADWTTAGCEVVNINSVDVCNCSLETKIIETHAGGQYIVYSYSSAVFDDAVYEKIGNNYFTDTASILEQGEALIRNGSLLLRGSDASLATKIMKTYCKYLSHVGQVLQNNARLKSILDYLNRGLDRFYDDPSIEKVRFIYGIPTSWSVKNAALASDLYSNAVLADADIGAELTATSDFVLAAIGRLDKLEEGTRIYGVEFKREEPDRATYLQTADKWKLRDLNPVFACYVDCYDLLHFYRFIFVIYPMNMSPYPYSMTTRPIFNSRQVDVHVDTKNENWRLNILSVDEPPKCEKFVHVFFQPSVMPKNYINVECASWDDSLNDWTEEFCQIDIIDQQNAYCSCSIGNRRVTRIIIYEYTDLENFSLLHSFDGPSVIFLIGAFNSLCGFVLIVATAILFPPWCAEQSNKILLQLTASSCLYLAMTMILETHLIYAQLKRLDWALVAFSVLLHYTRLVHYFWALVMSVLQYKKFATVVGASATSHLLLKISVFAWLSPLVPLIALLSWDQQAHFCTPDELTHYVLYLVPVVVITLLNIGLLLGIIYHMTNGCGRWDDEELKKHGGSDGDVKKRQIKQAVMMFFLFGIPAVFEMVNDIANHSVTLDYISNVLNPIQGFILFLFFVVLHDKTSALWFIFLYGSVPSATGSTVAKKAPSKLQFFKNKAKPVPRPAAVPESAETKPTSEVELEMSVFRIEADDLGDEGQSVIPDSREVQDISRDSCSRACADSNSGAQGQCSDGGLQTNKMVATFEEESRCYGDRVTDMIEFLRSSARVQGVDDGTRPSSGGDQGGREDLSWWNDFFARLRSADEIMRTELAESIDTS